MSKKKKIIIITSVVILAIILIVLLIMVFNNASNNNNWNNFISEDCGTITINQNSNLVAENNKFKFVDFYSDKHGALVGENEEITFYAKTNIPTNNKIELYSDEKLIGELFDNGEGADEKANDNIYTGKFNLSSNKEQKVNFWVSCNDTKSITRDIMFYTLFTNSELDNYDTIISKISLISKKYFKNNQYIKIEDIDKLFNEIVKYIDSEKDKGNIIEYKRNDDNIYILLKGNVPFVFAPEIYERLSGGTSAKIITCEPSLDVFTSINSVSSEIYSVIASLASGDFGYNYIGSHEVYSSAKMISDATAQFEYNYNKLEGNSANWWQNDFDDHTKNDDHYTNSQVTIDSLKNLDTFGVFIYEGHGNYTKETGSFLVTGEDATKSKNINKYADDIKANRILCKGGFMGSDYIGATYVVTANFFDTYLKSIDNAFVYLGACHSG